MRLPVPAIIACGVLCGCSERDLPDDEFHGVRIERGNMGALQRHLGGDDLRNDGCAHRVVGYRGYYVCAA